MRIVSFDVGIKNLAYCIMESSPIDNSFNIIKWDVINLCGQEMNCNCPMVEKVENVEKVKKIKKDIKKTVVVDININKKEIQCNKKAVYSKNQNYYCKTHVKKQDEFIIPTSKLSIQKFKKMKLVELQELCVNYKIEYPVGCKKEIMVSKVLSYMQNKFLDTIGKQSANAMTLIDVGIAIRKELDNIPLMLSVDRIIIENQISPIANRMKTIQGMIAQYFIMNNKTDIAFISSANKLKAFTKPLAEGEEKIKSTYAERKQASIDITLNLLENSINSEFKQFFSTHKKKDDLADSFLQGIWYLTKQTH
jgi:hypothetical protein